MRNGYLFQGIPIDYGLYFLKTMSRFGFGFDPDHKMNTRNISFPCLADVERIGFLDGAEQHGKCGVGR